MLGAPKLRLKVANADLQNPPLPSWKSSSASSSTVYYLSHLQNHGDCMLKKTCQLLPLKRSLFYISPRKKKNNATETNYISHESCLKVVKLLHMTHRGYCRTQVLEAKLEARGVNVKELAPLMIDSTTEWTYYRTPSLPSPTCRSSRDSNASGHLFVSQFSAVFCVVAAAEWRLLTLEPYRDFSFLAEINALHKLGSISGWR